MLVALWCQARGIPLMQRDGTLVPGLIAGALFGLEFILIYQGLVYTTATRAVLFIYLAPFFVALGARIVLPADRFNATQWVGLALSFCGMLLAFGVPTPALDPRQALGDLMMVGAAAAWALTTLVIKASALNRSHTGKDAALSARRLGPDAGARRLGVRRDHDGAGHPRWRSARSPTRPCGSSASRSRSGSP